MKAAVLERRALDRALWVAGGVLLGAPFLSSALEWLVLLAPLPWLVAIDRSGERAFRRGYLGGFAFILTGLSWLVHVHPVAWVIAAAYYALYPAAWAVMVAVARRRGVPLFVAAPLATWAAETLVSHVTLFEATWLALGYTAWRATTPVQAVELLGVSGVSAIIVLISSALLAALLALLGRASWRERRTVAPLAAAALAVAAAFAWGAARMPRQDGAPTALTVALVQGNVPQEIRVRPAEADAIVAKHVRLSLGVAGRADVIAWPESTANYFLDQQPGLVTLLAEAARQAGAPLLVGALATNPDPDPPSNAAYLVTSRGIEGRADKRVLVPGAETLLLLDHVKALREPIGGFLSRTMHFRPYLKAGSSATPLTLKRRDGREVTVGTLICYDDNVPGPPEDLRAEGAAALIVMSNEAWFGTKELDQHLAMAALRCIETRLPMGRATNTGRTCALDPCGRVIELLPKDEDGVIVADLPAGQIRAIPGWWRELLALLVTAGMLGLVVRALLAGRREARTAGAAATDAP